MHVDANGLVIEETAAYTIGSRLALAESVEHGEAEPPTPQGADTLADRPDSAGESPKGGSPVHASRGARGGNEAQRSVKAWRA